MIEEVLKGKEVIAIIIRSSYDAEGIKFLTPDSFSQQLAYMKRPSGYYIAPHVHNDVVREVHYTKEVLFIKKGKVRVDLFTDDRKYLESRVLLSGDVILLAQGGHGFEMLEETVMIEVKQGPYVGEQDKTRFDRDLTDKIVIKGGAK
jgi:hypothetical protein